MSLLSRFDLGLTITTLDWTHTGPLRQAQSAEYIVIVKHGHSVNGMETTPTAKLGPAIPS